jgi:hypothetical protein
MITIKTCFASEGAMLDQGSNMVSAWNIISGIKPVGLPLVLSKLSFCILWQREEADPVNAPGEFSIALNNSELLRHAIYLDFGTGKLHWTMMSIAGLVITEPGTLLFQTQIQGNPTTQYNVPVDAPNATIQAVPNA